MCLSTFIDHVPPVLRGLSKKIVPFVFLLSTTWAPHGRHQSNGRHALRANHFPKRAQILERRACHAYMTDRMEVDQACKSDLFLLIRDPEPVCQVFQHVTVAAIRIVEAGSVNQMDLKPLLLERPEAHGSCFLS